MDMMILSISLGTRDSGVALFSQGELTHWQMHQFGKRWSDEKLNSILVLFDRYVIKYRVKWVIIKTPPATHRSKAFLSLLEHLTRFLKYRDCLVTYTTKAALKKSVPEVTNTETIMEYVTRHYPILLPEQARELKSKRPYHTKMFEAVLVAHVFRKSLE